MNKQISALFCFVTRSILPDKRLNMLKAATGSIDVTMVHDDITQFMRL